ncbi:MAG: AsmA-like C-terminal domain-containing protein [Magnetococcales bacterium]|nr:AsmA-like C-terminal domain-containing protein [Magnetococcales bacterium]
MVRRVVGGMLVVVVTLGVMLIAGVAGLTLHPPDLTPYAGELSRFLSERSGLTVRLAGIELESGLSLAVVGTGVEIAEPDSEQPLLTAGRVLLRVSPLLLLRGGLPMSITLDQVRATVRRDAAGRIHLGARPLDASASAGASVPGGVLLNALTITRGELFWEDAQVTDHGHPTRLTMTGIQASGFLEHSGVARFTAEASLSTQDTRTRLSVTGARDARNRWSAKLRVEQGVIAPFLPYLAQVHPLDGLTTPLDLSVELSGNPEAFQAQWRLVAGAGQLGWPSLFRWPLPITRLGAEGRLERSAKGWDLEVRQFELRSSHGQAQGKVLITGLGGPGSPFLDLTATASGTPSDKAKFYYPTRIMFPPLVQWLDNGLKDGHVKQASVQVRGHFADLPAGPSAPAEDVFHIEGDVVGLSLHYFPPLLPLTHVTTHVVFDRHSMSAQVSEGTYGATRQVKGTARIADMVDNPVVEISAESPQVDMASVWQEIVSHPRLRWDQAVGMAAAEMQGQGVAGLKITLPLKDLAALTYSGRLEMKQAGFHPDFLEHPLVEVGGVMTLDQDRLDIQVNRGRLGPWPVVGEVTARQYRTPGKALFQARVDTRLEPAQLAEWAAPLLGEEGWIQGQTPVRLEFSRQPGEEGFGVKGQGELNALAGRGRMGWNKRAEEAGQVLGAGRLLPDGRLRVNELRVEAGNLHAAGQGEWDLARDQGKITLKTLKLDRSAGKMVIARGQVRGVGAWTIDADWNRLDLGGLWRTVPAGPARMADSGEVATSTPERSWPKVSLRLRAERLLLAQGEQAEELDADLEMELRSVSIDALRMKQGASEIQANGSFLWSRRIGSGGYGGRLRVTSRDFGRLLRSLDLHQGLEAGSGEMDVSLDGFQAPDQRWLDTLSGTARFDFREGKIRRLGFLSTLLGLFSLKDLPDLVVGTRPDLDVAGLHYKAFHGTFAIHDSVWTIDRMKLLSPSMNLVVTGKVDFPRDRVDLLVGVRPLQALDDLVNGVPLLGKWVTGDRRSVVETLFDVSGSTQAPQATIRPVASLAPGLLRDLLHVPLEWLRRTTETGNQTGDQGDQGDQARKSP